MRESERRRVQALSTDVGRRLFCAAAVYAVADQRESGVLQVDADLMRASGFQPAAEQCEPRPFFFHRVSRCGFASGESRGHLLDVFAAAGEGDGHDAGLRGVAANDGEVFAADGSGFESVGQSPAGVFVFGDDHQAAGVFVQTMHESAAREDGGGGVVAQEAVEESSAVASGAGMDGESGGLVCDEDVGVLKDDGEGDVLGDGAGTGGRFGVGFVDGGADDFPGGDGSGGLVAGFVVHFHFAAGDFFFPRGAGDCRTQGGEGGVQSGAVQFGGDCGIIRGSDVARVCHFGFVFGGGGFGRLRGRARRGSDRGGIIRGGDGLAFAGGLRRGGGEV